MERAIIIILCLLANFDVYLASSGRGAVLREITVKRGYNVVLRPEHLQIATDGSIVCRIEIVHDPICLRFGNITYDGFPCNLNSSKNVAYLHSGSLISSTDCIKMNIFLFYENRTRIQTMKVTVVVENRPTEEELSLPLLTVDKIGGKASFSKDVLPPFVKRYLNKCEIQIGGPNMDWPANGVILMQERVKQGPSKCNKFNATYVHDGSYIPNVDYIPFALSCKDKAGNIKNMRYQLEVRVKGAQRNDHPVLQSRRTRLIVKQYSITQIKVTSMRAIDYRTEPSKLLLKISSSKRYSPEGFFSSVEYPNTPLEGITQDMIDKGKLLFVAPKTYETRRRRPFIIEQFQVQALDQYGAQSKKKLRLVFFVRKFIPHYLSVVINKPMRVLEGKSSKLTTEILDILCPGSNCNRAKFSVVTEPKHGSLLILGQKINQFMYENVKNRKIFYKHDNSENLVDNIVISVMEQSQLAFVTLNVIVEPIDDSPPFLSVHKDILARNGQLTKIKSKFLQASDPDSSVDDIMFKCVTKPKGGSLKMYKNGNFVPVEGFSESDRKKGLIYYHADSKEPTSDSIVFILSDKIPNLSKTYTVQIKILATDTIPPQKRYGGECLARMNETDASLSLNFIDYIDNVSPSSDIFIKIFAQKQPDYNYIRYEHIVRKLGYEKFPATAFTQQELFHNKIFYLNTNGEVGSHAKNLRLDFVVSDKANNTTPVESCTIVIEPVDNKAPVISVLGKIKVREGGRVCLNKSDIEVTDVDSIITKVKMGVKIQPKYGRIIYKGMNMSEGEFFNYLEFRHQCLWYYHDDSETETDSFMISATDGINHAKKIVKIDVEPVNDQRPKFVHKTAEIRVMENSSVAISPELLEAIDEDSKKSDFRFYMIKNPKLGYLQMKKMSVKAFMQDDVDNGMMVYTHKIREIGPISVYDNFTVAICDVPSPSKDCVSVIRIKVEIAPINSSPPSMISGNDLVVKEGSSAMIGTNEVKCKDIDTLSENIEIRILKFPRFGYLENVSPSVGSEQSNAGLRISKFLCSDLDKKSVNYVQDNHTGFEPHSDSFQVIAFDGAFNSTTVMINIQIRPINDERPTVVQIAPIKVQEGGWMLINKNNIRIIDKDIPKDVIQWHIARQPKHGQMFYKCNGGGSPQLKRLKARTLIDYQRCAFIYVHDDSETLSDELHIEATDGKMAARSNVYIEVKPVNDKKPEIVKNIVMIVRFGGFKNITKSYLVAQDIDTDAAQLEYKVTKLPSYGSLKLYKEGIPSRMLLNSSFTQDDIDTKRLSYVNHIMPVSGLTDSFHFSLSDGVHFLKNQTFTMRIRLSCRKYFRIKTKNVKSNGPKIYITSSNLRAQKRKSDRENDGRKIVFHIIKQPKYGVLSLDSTGKGGKVTLVTEIDLKERRLTYRPYEYPRKKNDSFRFFATDGKCMQRGKLHIFTIDQNVTVVLMKRISPLYVVQRGTTSVTSLEIRALDKFDADKVIYRIKTLPKHGIMLKDGVNVSSFSQKDINELRISYLLMDVRAKDDGVNIEVFVKNFYGLNLDSKPDTFPLKVSINIPNIGNVRVITNEPITALENLGQNRIGTMISKRNLLLYDCLSNPNSNLTYTVIEPPVHGEIIFKVSGRQGRKFTQGDINAERVIYKLTDPTHTDYSDSLILDAESKGCKTLSGVEFTIKWSVISISDEIKVECKGGKTSIAIRLLRAGYANQGSVVEVHTKPLPDGAETIAPSRIWFHPGDKELTWKMAEEALEYEKVEIYLSKEFNTLLGKSRIMFDITKSQDACSLEREKNKKDLATVKAESTTKANSTDQFHAIKRIKTSHDKRNHRFSGKDSAYLDLKTESRQALSSCMKDWVGFRNNCYFASSKKTNWRKATKFCKKRHAYLYTPSSVLEETVVMKIRKETATWIGVKVGRKKNWKWNVRKMRQPFLRKLASLENQRNSNKLCVYISAIGEWKLNNCKEKGIASFVCKRPKKQNIM